MREILFRGKRIDNGAWVYGGYVPAEKLDRSGIEHLIIEIPACGETYNIFPVTLCQYTGLTDKNGKMIFEGDIVKAENGHISRVEYFGAAFVLRCNCHKDFIGDLYSCSEVIGNIHDNPELLT